MHCEQSLRCASDARTRYISLRIAPFKRPVRWRKLHRTRNLNKLRRVALNTQAMQAGGEGAALSAEVDTRTLIERRVSGGDSTTMQKSHVPIGIEETVSLDPLVLEDTAVTPVVDHTLDINVLIALYPPTGASYSLWFQGSPPPLNLIKDSLFTISPLHRQIWAHYMANHPNREFANEIMDYIDFGASTYFEGPMLNQVFKNWKSSKKLSKDVSATILNDVKLGRKLGPFSTQPTTCFVGSPMGAIEKLSDKKRKVRIITDLSWPPDRSVNNFIPKDKCSLSYVTIDDALEKILKHGQYSNLFKLDLAEAYRNIVVKPSEWNLLGTTWSTSEDDKAAFYLDTRLPFGLRSAARQFDKFASGLQFIMESKGVCDVIHYLDDFLNVTPDNKDFSEKMKNTMLEACDEAGLPVNFKKVVGPTKCLEFLGIIIDTTEMITCISEERLQNVKKELLLWKNRKSGTKRQLLSLLGKLVFISRIIRPGRIFVRRLFNATMKLKHLHYKIKLSSEARKDVLWWLKFIETWNRKSVFYELHWRDANDYFFSTDASDLGYAGVFQSSWAYNTFKPDEQKMPIAWRELFALVSSCSTWGNKLCGQKIYIWCDNMNVIQAVNNGTSKNSDIMILVRHLFHIASTFNFEVRLRYIKSRDNVAADLLSRLNIDDFKRLYPFTDRNATKFNMSWKHNPPL